MTRLPDIESKPMTAEQRAVFDRIAHGPRGRVEGPLRCWLHSPQLADLSQALGAFCRYGTVIPHRLSELAIITVGAHWRAGFEFHVHAPIARSAGIDDAAVEAIRTGSTPQLGEDEQLVYNFTRSLLVNQRVSHELFAQVRLRWSERGVVELVGLIGYYNYICLSIVAFDVAVPGEDPFANVR